jgi:hypothetical protein
VISPVDTSLDVAWLPNNLPSEDATAAPVVPTTTPTLALPPVSNFQPVLTAGSGTSGSASSGAAEINPVLFPTNTPRP